MFNPEYSAPAESPIKNTRIQASLSAAATISIGTVNMESSYQDVARYHEEEAISVDCEENEGKENGSNEATCRTSFSSIVESQYEERVKDMQNGTQASHQQRLDKYSSHPTDGMIFNGENDPLASTRRLFLSRGLSGESIFSCRTDVSQLFRDRYGEGFASVLLSDFDSLSELVEEREREDAEERVTGVVEHLHVILDGLTATCTHAIAIHTLIDRFEPQIIFLECLNQYPVLDDRFGPVHPISSIG